MIGDNDIGGGGGLLELGIVLDVDILIPWLCFLGPPGLGEKRRTAVRWFVFVAFLRLGASVCGEQVQLSAVKKTMLRCSGVSKQISGFSPPFFFLSCA